MTADETSPAWGSVARDQCPHVTTWHREAASTKTACEACALTTDLRICLTCGYVGCCESHGAHDTEHFRKSGHPLIRPHRSYEDFLWCYSCNAFLK